MKTAGDPTRSTDIVGTDDMKYSVTTITAKRGETLGIRLISKGTIPKVAMAHNVVVLKLGTDVLKLLTDGAGHLGVGLRGASTDARLQKEGLLETADGD